MALHGERRDITNVEGPQKLLIYVCLAVRVKNEIVSIFERTNKKLWLFRYRKSKRPILAAKENSFQIPSLTN